MYVSYKPDEFEGLLNVTISDVIEIIHPERKAQRLLLELTTNSTGSNQTELNSQTLEVTDVPSSEAKKTDL